MAEGGRKGVGRPKEGLESLPKAWKKKMLSMYENGASDVEVQAWIWKKRGSFSNDLWYRWMKEEPDFSETVNLGHKLCESWWQNMGRTNLTQEQDGPKFNSTLWYMNMKNRFGWADKQETQVTGAEGGPVQTQTTVTFIPVDAND